MVRLCPTRTEDHLLVGHQPGQPDRVDPHAGRALPAAGPGQHRVGGGVGRNASDPSRRGRALGHPLGGAAGPCPTVRRACRRGGARSISTPSIWGAASSANRIISTAPMAKLAATIAVGGSEAGERGRTPPASSASVNPVVPTTAWMPASAQKARLSRAASRRVKSTTTSAPGAEQGTRAPPVITSTLAARGPRPARRARRRRGRGRPPPPARGLRVAETARHTSWPIRPAGADHPDLRMPVTLPSVRHPAGAAQVRRRSRPRRSGPTALERARRLQPTGRPRRQYVLEGRRPRPGPAPRRP